MGVADAVGGVGTREDCLRQQSVVTRTCLPTQPPAMSMHVVIVTYGTRGDVQPMSAIALELMARGHSVLLACPRNHVGFVEALGVRAHGLVGDSEELLTRPEGREWVATGNARELVRGLMKLITELADELARDIERACVGADVIVTGLIPAVIARANAERNGVPLVVAHTFPTLPTREFTSALVDLPVEPPRMLRPMFTRALLTVVKFLMRRLERPLRARYQLPPARKEPSLEQFDRGRLSLQLWSPAFIPRPADWRENEVVTGFCALPTHTRTRLGETHALHQLEEFLAAGSAPLYFGLGSMPVLEWKPLVERLLRITGDLDLRLVLSGELDKPDLVRAMLPSSAVLVGKVDHDALFPRCCAVIHHGGAGSTATGLRAGKPTMVCAVLGDQPFFGRMVTRLGLGSWARMRGLTEERLRAGIETLLRPDVVERARLLGERMRAERPGAAVAADALEGVMGT